MRGEVPTPARRGQARRRGLGILSTVVLPLAAFGCADDGADPNGSFVSSSPPTANTAAPVSSSAGVVDPGGSTTDSPGAGASSAPPLSIAVDSVASLPPPAGLEDLAPGLLSANEVGVPDTWAIRDLDRGALADPIVAADTDPLLGIVDCADGTILPGDRAWVARRFSGPDEPLSGGLLSIELIIGRGVGDPDGLSTCAIRDRPVTVNVIDGSSSFSATAEPSAEVPFPSAISVARRHADGFTVTVVMGGVDEGTIWDAEAAELAQRVLDRLG